MTYRCSNAVDVHLNKINDISHIDSTLRIRGIRVHKANMELQLLEGLHENLQTNLSLNQYLLWNWICRIQISILFFQLQTEVDSRGNSQ